MKWVTNGSIHELHVNNRLEAEVTYERRAWQWRTIPRVPRRGVGRVISGTVESLEAAKEMVETAVKLSMKGLQ